MICEVLIKTFLHLTELVHTPDAEDGLLHFVTAVFDGLVAFESIYPNLIKCCSQVSKSIPHNCKFIYFLRYLIFCLFMLFVFNISLKSCYNFA